MGYNTYIITNHNQLDTIYNNLRDSARLRTNPDIYFVGLDIEYITKYNFPESFQESHKWVRKTDDISVCKLQISTENLCVIIDLCSLCNNFDMPDKLVNILKSESWMKAGVGISNDLSYLSHNYNLGHCNGCFDVRTFSYIGSINNNDTNFSLIDLYNAITNKNDKKKVVSHVCDWSKSLSIEQIEYASKDAYMSYIVGYFFLNNIISKNKTLNINTNVDINSINNETNDIDSDNVMIPLITDLDKPINYVGLLQEMSQKNNLAFPIYTEKEVNSLSSPLRFEVICDFQNKTSKGYGPNKKNAKHIAASEMYQLVNNI